MNEFVNHGGAGGRCQAVELLERIRFNLLVGQDQPGQDALLRRVIPDFDWFTHDVVGASKEGENEVESSTNIIVRHPV